MRGAIRGVYAIWAVAALCGCQAKVPPADPSVSGESHFLSACGALAPCPAGLDCLCGLCTVACTDDAVCSSAAEAGAVCTDAATCETAGRTCTRACAADVDCGAGLACSGGVCVAGGAGSACVPPDLGLSLSPMPAADVYGQVESVSVDGDRLTFGVRVNHGPATTYTVTGPFADIPQAALAAPWTVSILVDNNAPGGFWLTLLGCGRPHLRVVNASRALVERAGESLVADRTPDDVQVIQDGICPGPCGLNIDGMSLLPGRQAGTMLSDYHVGRVQGCASDPTGQGGLEFAVTPHDPPQCGWDALPNNGEPSFTLTDDAGRSYFPPSDVVVEIGVTATPGIDTEWVLEPTEPTPAFTRLHLRAPAGLPAAWVGPASLHVFADVSSNELIVEVSDTSGLRFAGASSGEGDLRQFKQLQVTRLASTCATQVGAGGLELFQPLHLQRNDGGPASQINGLGTGTAELGGPRVDLRASATQVNGCATDSLGTYIDFAAVWE